MLQKAELKYYSMVLGARGTALSHTTAESGSGASMYRTDMMVLALQQTSCLCTVGCEWMERAPVAKLVQLVKGVEARCVGVNLMWKACLGCDHVCGGRRVHPLAWQRLTNG